jgi:D-aspartate ligase
VPHEQSAPQQRQRHVAVFDVGIPPALAFIRSLGSGGVPIVAYSSRWGEGGRFSRFAGDRRSCPHRDSPEFVTWLATMIDRGEIDLVAPTSDQLAFSIGEAMDRLGRSTLDVGFPPAHGIRTCLFKARFAEALGPLGFPTPPAAGPQSLPEAVRAADEIGYPLVIKPRSHIGIGSHRGVVVMSSQELAARYHRYEIEHADAALRHAPSLASPILQKYFHPGTTDVVSITGCLDRDGAVLALAASRKLRQLPRRFGVGTLFEPIPLPSFADDAVEVVRAVLGHGIFELEVLVDAAGAHYAIDLNPRAFGQITLDIARGRDLPKLWYRSVCGEHVDDAPAVRSAPRFWQDAVPRYAELVVNVVRGPNRRSSFRHEVRRLREPRVGAAFDRRDPIPGVLFGLSHLRHPRAFGRRLLRDVERGQATYTATTS